MPDKGRSWRSLSGFITGEGGPDVTSGDEPRSDAHLDTAPKRPVAPRPPTRRRRPTRVAVPVSTQVPVQAPTPARPGVTTLDPNSTVALPDHIAPPGAVIVAGVDANGVEYVFEDDPAADPLVDPRYDLDDRNWVRYRTSWGGIFRIVIFIVFVLFVAGWVRGKAYGWIDAQIDPPGPIGAEIDFNIPKGASTNDVASSLAAKSIISNGTVFRYWLRCEGDSGGRITLTGFLGCSAERTFRAGDYVLNENMNFDAVVAKLDEGPIPEPVFDITIPEGLRLTELIDRLLAQNDRFTRDDLEKVFADESLTSKYLDPDVPSLFWFEGMLFPAKYDVPERDRGNERKLIDRMSNTFDERFGALLDDPGRAPVIDELGLTDYQVVIVASLIEEEAKVDSDRAKIARVIYNRLLKGEKLGIDATTYYAVGKPFTEPLLQSDLDSESPWNTRAVAGLPPTPIAAPGEASLKAALQPADGDWFFYVLTDEGGVKGAHTFATTNAEWQAALQACTDLGYCG